MKLYGKAESIGKRIIEQFQSGNLPQALAQSFLQSGKHCEGWSWANRLLVALAGYSDAATYNTWVRYGRRVRKGEKAFHILAPCTRKIEETTEDGEVKERYVVYGFRHLPVFGVEQTDVVNEQLWDKHKPKAIEEIIKTTELIAVAKAWGIKLTTYQGRATSAYGWYAPKAKEIALGVANPSTFAHELVHAADDKLGNLGVQRASYASGEVVAELGAAILLTALGYERDADVGGAWQYIESWAKKWGKPPVKACVDLLDRTCSAVSLILETAAKIEQTTDATKQTVAPPVVNAEATDLMNTAHAV